MKKISVIISAFWYGLLAYGQVNLEWVQRYNGAGNRFDIGNSLRLDVNSNSYIYGTTSSVNNSTDILILKYNPTGSIVWTATFDGYGNSVDETIAGYLDGSGNSYITGISADTNQVIKIITLKCSSSGTLSWSKVFLPPIYNQGIGRGVVADNNSNVYVCGYLRRASGSHDIVTVKYGPNGDLLNSSIFTVTSSSNEKSVSMCLDNAGNVYVLGTTNAISGLDDILILKYGPSLNLLWQHAFSGSEIGSDQPVEILYTNDNKIAVTAAMLDAGNSFDYGIFRFDTNAVLIMQYYYNGPGDNEDIPFDMASDNQNILYITGSSRNADTLGSEDFATLKLGPTGQLLWERRYNGSGSGTDYGLSISVDALGNVYAGGTFDKLANHLAYGLIKYSPQGALRWFEQYSALSASEDFIYSTAVDNSYNVFVTGISFDSTSDYDIATIKYSQPIGIIPVSNEIPENYMLAQNYPNPFNPVTNIGFRLPKSTLVKLSVYDMLGRESEVLVNEQLNPGIYEIKWDASSFPSGVYFYSLVTNSYKETKKLVLIK